MKNNNVLIKRTLDIILTILLLFLMAYQVTGELWHEWLGIAMTLLVIVHHILNRQWYASLFKGKYTGRRIIVTIIDFLLLISFALAALTGVSMSAHAVPFLNGLIPMMAAMKLHLGVSCWSYVLMGVHIGLHVRPLFAGDKLSRQKAITIRIILSALAVLGLVLFIMEGMPKYLAFMTHFAMHPYDAPAAVVILRNIIMMLPWVYIGIYLLHWEKK